MVPSSYTEKNFVRLLTNSEGEQGGLGMTGSQRRCWLFRESSKEIFLGEFHYNLQFEPPTHL